MRPFRVQGRETSDQVSVGEAANLDPVGVKILKAYVTPPAIVDLEFTLPAHDSPFVVPAVAVRSDRDGTAFAFVNLSNPDFLRLPQQVQRLFLRRQLYIMVVEDDCNVAETFADYAEDMGYVAVIMPTAEEALTYLAEDQPDAILLYLYRPRMSGLKFLETLAQQGLRVPIVVISAASESYAVSSLKAGVLRSLHKPFSIWTSFA